MSGVSLETLCTLLTDGTHYTPPNAGDGVPFLTVADMQPNGLNFSSCSRITTADFEEARRQNSAPLHGDVLFSKDGTVGKVHVVNGEGQFAVLSSIAIIRPDPAKLDSSFLSHFLRTPAAISAADRSKTGSALRRIILKDIRRLKIDAPSLKEQKRIAAVLDQADDLRRLRNLSLNALESIGSQTFKHMFGDPKHASGRWPLVSFDDACRDETARSDKLQRGSYLPTGQYPVVDQGQKAIAGWTDDADLLCRSSLPLIVFGDHTRIVKLVDFPFVIGADGAKILVTSERFDPTFFSYWLRLAPLPDLGYSRHMREVKRMQFWCPPLPLQQQFASRIEQLNKLRRNAEDHAAQMNSLFTSLQHRAFRREL